MTRKECKRLAITLGVIAFVAIGATSCSSTTVTPAGQEVPTATLLPTVLPAEAEATATAASTKLTSTAVPETESCCKTVFVDLETAPEGVWSNASAVLVPQGWCVLLQRDQRWQQVRDEVELRQTWEEGATEDFLLLCNPGPGARFYSLESEFGGRPRDWWNDQAKKVWAFPDPTAVCRPGVIVLYENDDSNDFGWLFEIPVR